MIEGFFDPGRADRPLPHIKVRVLLDGVGGLIQPQSFDVNFLIDTGAFASTLHPDDAVFGAGIPPGLLLRPDVWPEVRRRAGIGGSAMYFPVTATYDFLQSDGQVLRLHGQLEIAQLDTVNRQIPSLLGWDILQHFKLTLDWPTRVITLE